MDESDPCNASAHKEVQEGEFTEVLLVERSRTAKFVEDVAKEGRDVVNAAVYSYFRGGGTFRK